MANMANTDTGGKFQRSAQFMFGRCLKTWFVSRLAPHENEFATSINTSFTMVGNSADSPEPLLRPLPATGLDAEILDVSDPDLGYYAEKFPYKLPQEQ
jgi:hypothetical protein